MANTPAARKAKGRRFQQWCANCISELISLEWGADKEIASREMGQSGTDIRLVGEALKRFPWSVECKNQESWCVPAWINQAKKNMIPGTDWLLIIKRNNDKPVVVIDAGVFFDLLRAIKGKKKGRRNI